MKTEAERKEFLLSLPVPPEGCALDKLESRIDPDSGVDHYFTVGPKHVAWAADHHNGYLGEDAIESAEKHGIFCAHKGCGRSYAAHKTILILFVSVPDNKDLNAVPGLVAYLNLIKEQATAFGVEGFAFPVAS